MIRAVITHGKLTWHRQFLPRCELASEKVLKTFLDVAFEAFRTSRRASCWFQKDQCYTSRSVFVSRWRGSYPPPFCAGSSLLCFCFEAFQKYDTSVLKGAELHKETKDKFLVLSKLEIFPLVNFPPLRSVNRKQDVAQRLKCEAWLYCKAIPPMLGIAGHCATI